MLTTELHLRYFTINYHGKKAVIIEGSYTPTGCSASYSDGVPESGVNQVSGWRHILHSNHHTITYIWPIKTHEIIIRPATMPSKSLIIIIPFAPRLFLLLCINTCIMISQTNALFIDTKSDTLLSSFYPNFFIIVLKV